MKNMRKIRLLIALLLSGSGSVFAGTAGHVQFVSGNVQLINAAGQSHAIVKGEVVTEGDILSSAKNSSAQIRMQDGGIIALRADTRIRLDAFKYSGQEDGTERSFTSLIKGGFRSVTGAIGHVNKSNYRITTPTSTIGIRGTDHETVAVVPDSELAAVAPVGTYNRVNLGETSITTDKGSISVHQNQMGYAGASNELPRLQPVNANLFSAAPAERPAGVAQDKQEQKQDKQEQQGSEKSDTAAASNDARSETASSEPLRNTSVVDAVPTRSSSSLPEANDTTAPVTAPVLVQASGQTINLNNQTSTTTGGTTAPIAISVPTAAYTQNDLAVAFATTSANYLLPFAEAGTLIAAPNDVNNALPNPSLVDRYVGKNSASSVSYTLNGTTTLGQAMTTLANGISFGMYNSTSSKKVVTGSTNCCAAGTLASPGAVFSHWIVGPAVNPVYLPEVLTGVSTYAFAGGTAPTVSFIGTAATLNSATLAVDFTQQMAAFNLGLTVGGVAWGASANAPLEGLYWNSGQVGFRATTMVNTGWAALTVTGGATGGDVVGQLSGNALNGAMLSYVLSGATSQVAGVAAFTGASANTATPYRIAALSTTGTIPTPLVNAGQIVPVMTGSYNNSANVLFDVAGNMTQFNVNQPVNNVGGMHSYNIGTAAAVGLGTDPVSGISWGRWQGGALAVTNLANRVAANMTNAGSSHWLAGPVMTAPVALPISGTYNYVLAGGTAPTDTLGGVGTLNSASLSANFTAQTVNFGVNVTTPNAGNLVASAANVPIEQKNFFNASSLNSPNGGANPGLLTVTCAAACPTAAQLSGNIGGVFVGSGGTGVGMVYGFSNGMVNVNGVAAFHR